MSDPSKIPKYERGELVPSADGRVYYRAYYVTGWRLDLMRSPCGADLTGYVGFPERDRDAVADAQAEREYRYGWACCVAWVERYRYVDGMPER
jgi:hypothetical protein